MFVLPKDERSPDVRGAHPMAPSDHRPRLGGNRSSAGRNRAANDTAQLIFAFAGRPLPVCHNTLGNEEFRIVEAVWQ